MDPLDRERSSFDPTVENAREQVLDATLEAVAAFEREAANRPGPRARVVPVNDDHNMAPLSLGLLVAYAQELDGGRLKDRYDFLPMFLTDDRVLLQWTSEPGIFLFSNYIWNYERNLKLSALVKEANPESITIHGGPSTPKYAGDCEEFFGTNPHVDITVRGEGEATFAAILDALDPAYLTDFSNLHDVAGISFRDPSGIVHTPDRPRIEDLDSIPSPYLLGLFEPFGQARLAAVVESNRGCPYGCTFCDWGSATLSRIRKFDMDRVKAELEWFSRNQLLFVSLCDANFGILERDVEIAEHIAELKRKYGFPKTAALNYAKNTMKHLRPIIDTFASVGLNIEPTVAVQSMDETTLKIVRRSNIKTEKYDELADEFRRSGLRLATDVMMGLPGSTVDSFKSDLQKCTDRDVRARCNPTVLLPNSPMNEPSYREEHGIVARPHEVLKETKTYTREDFDEMERLRKAYYVFDSYAVLRHVAPFVRSESRRKGSRLLRPHQPGRDRRAASVADHRGRSQDDGVQPRAAVELGPVRRRGRRVLGARARCRARHCARHSAAGATGPPARAEPDDATDSAPRPRLRRLVQDHGRDSLGRPPRRLGAPRTPVGHVPARRDQDQRPERHLWDARRQTEACSGLEHPRLGHVVARRRVRRRRRRC